MPVKCTKRSRPPSSGVMNPKPLSSLNHLTVPVPTDEPHLLPPRPVGAGPDGENVSGLTHRLQPESRGQLSRSGRDLVAVARTGHPGQPQRVAVVARDHVHVEVED